MIRAEPWQTAEISGSMRAIPITKPDVIVATIKRSRHPILIVGYEAVQEDSTEAKPIDYAIQIAELIPAQTVATSHIISEFARRGAKETSTMPILDIANRLKDPEWKGLDGKGQYDLAIFLGIQYNLEWVALSGLKHYAPHLKTISLDRYHQPHATWSFPNMTPEDWEHQIKTVVALLEDERHGS